MIVCADSRVSALVTEQFLFWKKNAAIDIMLI